MAHWTLVGYTEIRELGHGGAGRVVLARADTTGVPVAVKYLLPRFCEDEAFLSRFREEARLLASVSSPHVVRLYEYVEVDVGATAPGAAIVMEAVEGLSLRTILAHRPPLPPEAALVVLKGSLLGLVAAHAAGIVHRDYKPANVLVDTTGTSKLADFGVATRAGTTAGVEGTPPYMAPEQWRGQPATHASDIYAATATFFECVTGHVPYPSTGDDVIAIGLRHVNDPIPVHEVPPGLRELVRLGLAKDPDERYYDASVFLDRLEQAAVAAYGSGWERRGRHYLVRTLALLSLLLPGVGTASNSAATTTLGEPEPTEAGLPDAGSGAEPSGASAAGRLPGGGSGDRLPGPGAGLSRRGGALAGAGAGVLALLIAFLAVALLGPRMARPEARVADAVADTEVFGVLLPTVPPESPVPPGSPAPPSATVPAPRPPIGTSAAPNPTSSPTTTPSPPPSPPVAFKVTSVEILKLARVPGQHQVSLTVKIVTTNGAPFQFRVRFEDITSPDPPAPITLTSPKVTGPTLIQTRLFTVPPAFRCAFQLRVTVRAPVPIAQRQDMAVTNYRGPGETC